MSCDVLVIGCRWSVVWKWMTFNWTGVVFQIEKHCQFCSRPWCGEIPSIWRHCQYQHPARCLEFSWRVCATPTCFGFSRSSCIQLGWAKWWSKSFNVSKSCHVACSMSLEMFIYLFIVCLQIGIVQCLQLWSLDITSTLGAIVAWLAFCIFVDIHTYIILSHLLSQMELQPCNRWRMKVLGPVLLEDQLLRSTHEALILFHFHYSNIEYLYLCHV